ncbi:hypothetical protein C943_04293 [Mariniradius saccharolyticus AK6]|uniref:Uncharacterized protein n=1 Tax=Mariniradius saccharolyticus AK6 TaxID=1239962 RepID=M7XGM0_9BACT|nr:hypothetical protein C943_04293 [Mariniradius saccharolyticus AK6]
MRFPNDPNVASGPFRRMEKVVYFLISGESVTVCERVQKKCQHLA